VCLRSTGRGRTSGAGAEWHVAIIYTFALVTAIRPSSTSKARGVRLAGPSSASSSSNCRRSRYERDRHAWPAKCKTSKIITQAGAAARARDTASAVRARRRVRSRSKSGSPSASKHTSSPSSSAGAGSTSTRTCSSGNAAVQSRAHRHTLAVDAHLGAHTVPLDLKRPPRTRRHLARDRQQHRLDEARQRLQRGHPSQNSLRRPLQAAKQLEVVNRQARPGANADLPFAVALLPRFGRRGGWSR
jgi:hypothetical protein